VNLRWLVLGAYFPDLWGLDRVFMAFDPGVHRERWFGWLHTLLVPLILALPIQRFCGTRAFVSFVLSAELHVLTDGLDTLGVMLFFPVDTTRYALRVWPWYDEGTLPDLYRYFTCPASAIFEILCLVWALQILYKHGGGNVVRGFRALWSKDAWRQPAREGTPRPGGRPGRAPQTRRLQAGGGGILRGPLISPRRDPP